MQPRIQNINYEVPFYYIVHPGSNAAGISEGILSDLKKKSWRDYDIVTLPDLESKTFTIKIPKYVDIPDYHVYLREKIVVILSALPSNFTNLKVSIFYRHFRHNYDDGDYKLPAEESKLLLKAITMPVPTVKSLSLEIDYNCFIGYKSVLYVLWILNEVIESPNKSLESLVFQSFYFHIPHFSAPLSTECEYDLKAISDDFVKLHELLSKIPDNINRLGFVDCNLAFISMASLCVIFSALLKTKVCSLDLSDNNFMTLDNFLKIKLVLQILAASEYFKECVLQLKRWNIGVSADITWPSQYVNELKSQLESWHHDSSVDTIFKSRDETALGQELARITASSGIKFLLHDQFMYKEVYEKSLAAIINSRKIKYGLGFFCGLHNRCGSKSLVRHLSQEVAERIVTEAAQMPTKMPEERISTAIPTFCK